MPAIDFLAVFHAAITVLTLAVLEGLLSADNALIIAVAVKHLPEKDRGKALRYGLLGAFLFRGIALFLAATVVQIVWFKAVGGAYLLWLCVKHLLFRGPARAKEFSGGFWWTVLRVEVLDMIFSIDNVLVAAALSPNIIIIYLGGIMGIIAMRFVAGFFLRMLEKFPKLETAAYLLVGLSGIKLMLQLTEWPMAEWLFWTFCAILFGAAILLSRKQPLPAKAE